MAVPGSAMGRIGPVVLQPVARCPAPMAPTARAASGLRPQPQAPGSLTWGRSAAAAVAAGDGSTWLAGAGSAGSPQLWSRRSCWDRVGREGLWNRLDGLWNRNSLLYYVAVKRVLSWPSRYS